MSPEAQRIAIAEACGWKELPIGRLWEKEGRYATLGGRYCVQLPDYLEDLNCMREAESTLDYDQRRAWELVIASLFNGPADTWFDVCHMDAATRAKVFLKATGKWQDSPAGDVKAKQENSQ